MFNNQAPKIALELPQFSPEVIRHQEEKKDGNYVERRGEREIFYPDWKCFCCSDSGLVNEILLKRIIPEFNYMTHKQAACQRRGCEEFTKQHTELVGAFDMRMNASICQKLDEYNRQDWRESAKEQQTQIAAAVNKFVDSI